MKRTPFRRRHEAKTDYHTRLSLLKGGKPRLVLRRTNKYIIAQIVQSKGAQDNVIFTISSRDLMSMGWPITAQGSLKGRQAAYLTGLVIGKKAHEKKISEAILDIGMHRNIKKSRLYATLKGALDTGLSVPHDSSALPTTEQIEEHTKLQDIFTKIKEKIKNG